MPITSVTTEMKKRTEETPLGGHSSWVEQRSQYGAAKLRERAAAAVRARHKLYGTRSVNVSGCEESVKNLGSNKQRAR